MLHVVSLGAGVQSTTLVLLAKHGEVTPMPDAAVFADTQSEPRAVYEHLAWLIPELPFPVHTVTNGSLRAALLASVSNTRVTHFNRVPFFVSSGGMLHRQCTTTYKIKPIQRQLRDMLGIKPRARSPRDPVVTQWMGISTDEVTRTRPSKERWIRNRFPLIELGMSRWDCLQWMRAKGYPQPPKSSCTFCPYHDNALWRKLRDTAPEDFADAVRVDQAIRHGPSWQRNGSQWFVHRSCMPLDQVDLSTPEDLGQLTLFDEECSGMCGV